MRPYTEAVQIDLRKRMSPPHRQSVALILQEFGIHEATPYNWRKLSRLQVEVTPHWGKTLKV
jgi:transposase